MAGPTAPSAPAPARAPVAPRPASPATGRFPAVAGPALPAAGAAPAAAAASAAGAGGLAAAAPSNDARMRETARQFEAQMLGQMLAPMFSTVDQSRSRFGGGAAEAQWRPMLVDAYAQAASRRGGYGIADAVHRHMVRMQDARGGAATPPETPAR